jgi:hypothetical protein
MTLNQDYKLDTKNMILKPQIQIEYSNHRLKNVLLRTTFFLWLWFMIRNRTQYLRFTTVTHTMHQPYELDHSCCWEPHQKKSNQDSIWMKWNSRIFIHISTLKWTGFMQIAMHFATWWWCWKRNSQSERDRWKSVEGWLETRTWNWKIDGALN